MDVAWLIQEMVRSFNVKLPAPDQVLCAAADEVRMIFVPPHPAPLPSKVIVPAFETLPERVTLPVPMLVQLLSAAIVTAPEVKLKEAP